MYPLWTIIISDLKEGLEGCPVLSFGFFSPLCVAKSPHIWTEVSSKLSTNICIETILPISNCPFHMYQLWTIISSDLKEGLEGCPVLSFCLFSQPCSKISPHPNWSLQQVVNQHLHQTCITNIKLSVLYVPTMNFYQLWPERWVKRVSCPQFLSFFTTMFPDFPTSKLKSPASSQPSSAPNMHNQYQIVLSICTSCELLSTLTWQKG